AFWRGGVAENHDLDVIWPVGLRNTSDRAYTWPEGTTDADKARVFREVIGLQTAMVRDALPPGHAPLFHFTMYSEMLELYRRDPAAFGLPDDVIIVWPDDNDGHMRGLPTDLGRWKHGVYYHLAYLGGNLSKQTTHIVAPATIAREFQRIVQARATEYMLVNVSELRDYVMGARLIADITWNAPAVYASPDPAGRFVTWWTQEYFAPAAPPARAAGPGLGAHVAAHSRRPGAAGAARGRVRARRVPAVRPLVPRDVDPGRVAAQQPASRVRRAASVHRERRPLPLTDATGLRTATAGSGGEPDGANSLTRPGRSLVVALALAATFPACARPSVPAPAPAPAAGQHWLGTWAASVQLTEPRNMPPAPGLTGSTLRQVIHTSVGGPMIRVRFSNAFGSSPLAIT